MSWTMVWMEAELHAKFKAVHAAGKPVGQRWFLRSGKRIFQLLYPNQEHVDENGAKIYKCQFSVGWFTGFRQRWHISWRIDLRCHKKHLYKKSRQFNGFYKKFDASLNLRIQISVPFLGFNYAIYRIWIKHHFPSNFYRLGHMTLKVLLLYWLNQNMLHGLNDKQHWCLQHVQMESYVANWS